MSLLRHELQKLWSKKITYIYLLIFVLVNILFLWMGTRPQENAPPPAAYRAMQQDMQGMDMDEKAVYIDEKLQTITAILQLEQLYNWLAQNNDMHYSNGLIEQNQSLLDEYSGMYKNKNYNLYCEDEKQEYFFLTAIQNEITVVNGYDEFLNGIREKAGAMAGMSIFNDYGDYDTKNIELTVKAYENIKDVTINYAPQKGLYTALDYKYTDLIALFSMLLFASILVRQERDSGMFNIIRSTPRGRLKTAFAKICCLALSILVIIILLYGVNLVYCNALYGLGPLNRSIQSVPALMRCTMPINVMQYILRFILAKWAAAFVLGVWVMLAALICKKSFAGWCLALALPFVQFVIRSAIPATSKWNVIKYANLISLSRTNELMGNYRNLYWFDSPVPLWFVELFTGLITGVGFIILFLSVFSCAQLLQSTKGFKFFNLKTKSFSKGTTVLREEAYKALWINGIAVFLIVFCAFQIYQGITSQSYINAEEIYYSYYMKNLSGPYTKEKYMWLLEEREVFAPILNLYEQAANGEISSDEFNRKMELTIALQQKYNVFDSITTNKIDMLSEYPGSYLVYESGYEKLFSFKGQADINDTMLCGILCALCFSGIFAVEKSSGLYRVIRTTAKGQRYTVKAKLKIAICVCAVITLLISLPRYWQVLRDYGLPALTAPAMSLEQYRHISPYVPLFAIIIISLIVRFVACLVLCLISMALSQKIGNSLNVILICSAGFALPSLLFLSGFESIKYLSVYPLFHFPAMLAGIDTGIVTFVYLIISVMVIYFCGFYLLENYEQAT